MKVSVSGNNFLLLPERAILWEAEGALILSDAHFGKSGHFRKEGIALPPGSFHADLKIFDLLISRFSPKYVIVVGDMFHSAHNREIDLFSVWRTGHSRLPMLLVKGNHDILDQAIYSQMGIDICNIYQRNGFVFSHHPLSAERDFCFSGHIHPGVRLSGSARQNLKFPCFHFTPFGCTLPAFSKFTGLSIIDPQAGDRVFAIVGKEVMAF